MCSLSHIAIQLKMRLMYVLCFITVQNLKDFSQGLLQCFEEFFFDNFFYFIADILASILGLKAIFEPRVIKKSCQKLKNTRFSCTALQNSSTQSKHLCGWEYYNVQKVVEKKLVKTLKQSRAELFQVQNRDECGSTWGGGSDVIIWSPCRFSTT